MQAICYLVIFVFEQFISYIYFNNKFYICRSKKVLFLAFFISFLIQYGGSIIGNNINIPVINLITFFICNILIVLVFFKSNIRQAFFNVILLEGIMITSEIAVMQLTSFILKVDLQEYLTDSTVIVMEAVGTKTLYFALVYIISKMFIKKKYQEQSSAVSYLLFILPLTSIGTVISFTYISINYEVDQFAKALFTIISIILLITNIIVFIVHERMIYALRENTSLQLENQKMEINAEYYIGLQRQFNASNILIHDIKKCLNNIRMLAMESEYIKIINYIDSIYTGYEIRTLKQYSNNKLINVIISRYAQLCEEQKITFLVDIRDIDFSFMPDSDLTALLDNLLENSYEAARYSQSKQINLIIDTRNERYILIDLTNSSDNEPKVIGEHFISTKNNSEFHGIGLKSISRIVKRYSGDLKCDYDKESKTFKTSILIKSKN